jgi:hypothetical protein
VRAEPEEVRKGLDGWRIAPNLPGSKGVSDSGNKLPKNSGLLGRDSAIVLNEVKTGCIFYRVAIFGRVVLNINRRTVSCVLVFGWSGQLGETNCYC